MRRILEFLCLSCSNSSCFCMSVLERQGSMERKALIGNDGSEMVRIRDIMDGNQTLAYQLEPKVSFLFLIRSIPP